MHNRTTRSNKDKKLVNLTNQELADLERTNRKAKKPVKMPIILREDAEGNLFDREGNSRNEEGQRLDQEGNVIEEPPAAPPAALPAAAQPPPVVNNVAPQAAPPAPLGANRTLGDHNRPDLFYANRSAIRPPTFARNDFELKPSYFTLVGQHLFTGLPHEHPMDHIEKFEDLANSIKAVGVTDTWEEEDNGIQNIGPEGSVATWRFRHMIALGTARALAFLHHGCSPPMIHRDVKASSVYLDQNLEPRLSDFSLAKVFGNGLDEDITNGSPGYLPPEFLQPEQDLPTPKSDVYCFGVILFELITGKKPIEDEYLGEKDTDLVSWVRSLVRKNQGSKAIDPKIQETGSEEQMEEALKIGYLCTADLPSKRPSMQQVVGLLKDIEPKTNQ